MSRDEPHDLASLWAQIEAGRTWKYLYFWGHTPSGGAVGKECLSQWYPAPFEVDGHRYPTAEHFMMAGKARLFGDGAALARILVAAHPNEAKKVGRSVQKYDDALWNERRFDIVVAGNRAKFQQNPALGAFLAGTHGRVLVEASPVDAIWGIGLAADDRRAADPRQWKGFNLLGFALMVVRQELVAGSPTSSVSSSAS